MRNKGLIILLIVVLVLVVAVVTCGATFLVRSVDAYSYYENSELDAYNAKVIKSAGIKRNSSIFFVDEAAVKRKVERDNPDVGVINVRRSFPDRVTINYVIYERMYQFLSGDKYYQCYSSGRIGDSSATEMNGLFTVKPRGNTSTAIGEYFQPENAKDRQYVQAIIDFLHSKGRIDFEIMQLIKFIDLRREGYVYIRTNAGCSIEIHDSTVDFSVLLDRGFAIYAKTEAMIPDVVQTQGLIRVYPNLSEGAADPIRSTYLKPYEARDEGYVYTDEEYYARHYDVEKQ